MNHREEVKQFRHVLRISSPAEKMHLVSELRSVALKYVEPLKQKIDRSLSDETRVAYQEKGISLDWNLYRYEEVLEFCNKVEKAGKNMTLLQKKAVLLLKVCAAVLDHGEVTDINQEWILDAYAGLDDKAVKIGGTYSKIPSKNAQKPRVKLDDEHAMRDLIRDLNRYHPGATPAEIWLHLKSAIEELVGYCDEETDSGKSLYRYPFGDRVRTIGKKHFGEVLKKIRDEAD